MVTLQHPRNISRGALLGGVAAVALLVALAAAPSASALPFYGFNAIAVPCQAGEETVTPCTDNTEFSWHGGKAFVYRFAASQRCVDRYDRGYYDGGDWRRYDNAVDRVRSFNGEPFVVIQWAPAGYPCGAWRLPSNNTEYNAFYWWVRNLVRHFRSRGIQDYEVWNEPNLKGPATGEVAVSPQRYGYTYCNAWWALRDEGVDSRLHVGGISDNGGLGVRNSSDRYSMDTWLTDVNTEVRGSCPDARVSGISTHRYWEGTCRNSQYGTTGDFYVCLTGQRYLINKHWYRGPEKLLMLTETGVGDSRRAWTDSAGNQLTSIDRTQQRYNVSSLLASCDKAYRDQTYVRACFYYPIKEEKTWPYCSSSTLTGPRSIYGLVKTTCDVNVGQAYPAWSEYYAKLGTLP